MDYIIKGGTVCLEGEHFQADITLRDGKIWSLGCIGHKGSEEVIHADGMYVCPGGIDPHTHMDLQQSPKYRSCDDFYSGGVAAACGGTTTIIDHMALGPEGCSLRYPFEQYKKLAETCPVDYSFHGVFQHVDESILQELAELIEEGFPSFKAYTTYGYPMGETEMMKLFPVLKAHGGLLTVHAESDGITNSLRQSLTKDELAPIGQARTRPNAAEASAVGQVLATARACGDAPVYIVHTSAHESVAQLRLARQEGQRNVYSETCPQYLLLREDKFIDGGPLEGIKYMMAPPLRQKEDNEALWSALQDGTVQVVATDHCPFTIEEKQAHVADFRGCPGGVSGVEERMPLLFSKGVVKGRLSLSQFVRLTSTNAAKIFGLYPKKGTLLPGSDADIVIIDPSQQRTIGKDNLHTTCGYSPYEGMTTDCTISHVFLRGQLIAKNNVFLGQKGDGQLLRRKRTVPYEDIIRL